VKNDFNLFDNLAVTYTTGNIEEVQKRVLNKIGYLAYLGWHIMATLLSLFLTLSVFCT
jgi:hypothetical protein